MKKLGLSLSGGGARAYCFAGTIQALKDHHIHIHNISAHSGAALMLCFLYSGRPISDITQEYSNFSIKNFLSLNPPKNQGLLNTQKLIDYLNSLTNTLSIENAPYKTTITAFDVTDFDKPKKAFLKQGNLAQAAVASSTIPPLFPPYLDADDRILMDGGFISVYSAKNLRSMGSDIVIGCYPDALHFTKLNSFIEPYARLLKSLNSVRGFDELREEPVDLEIQNFDVDAGLHDYQKAQAMFDAGYKKTKRLLPKIKKLLEA